jgi:hypothetical protein
MPVVSSFFYFVGAVICLFNVIFLVFIGGITVLFTYVKNLASNEISLLPTVITLLYLITMTT